MYEVLLASASIMLSLICFMNDLKGKDGLNRNFIQRLFLFNSSGSKVLYVKYRYWRICFMETQETLVTGLFNVTVYSARIVARSY